MQRRSNSIYLLTLSQELTRQNEISKLPSYHRQLLHRKINRESWLRKSARNLPLAVTEAIILTIIGALIGALIPGIPLMLMGIKGAIALGMEIGAILFGCSAFLSGLILGLPRGQPRQ